MESKPIIDRLNLIEEEFNVWGIQYGNLPIWPLLRFDLFHLYYRNLNFAPPPTFLRSNSGLGSIKRFFSDLYWISKSYLKTYAAVKKVSSYDPANDDQVKRHADFLLYGISTHRSLNIESRHFNRITDSLDIYLKKRGSTFHMESLVEQPNHTRYGKTKIIDPELDFYVFRRKIKKVFFPKDVTTKGIREFIDFLIKKNIPVPFTEASIVERCEKIYAYKSYFTNALLKISPKLIFLDIYYHDRAMALTLAARDLNIPVIEVQHGIQGKHHFAYGRWKNFPATGSNLLPDYFWVWDQSSYNAISEWAGDAHPPFIGGNTLLSAVREEALIFKLSEAYLAKLKSYKSVILITLAATFEKEVFYLKIIADLIRNSSAETYWIFRCHPGNVDANLIALKELLNDLPTDNINIHVPKEINLYALLASIDTHITYTSTVCLEAAIFGIKNIVMGKEGFDHYKENIEEGEYYYAENYEALKSIIHHDDTFDPKKNSDAMVTNETWILQQIDNLLSVRKQSF